MPRIDFYVLPDASPNGRFLLACRVTDKAFRHGHRVYIHASSHSQAVMLDELLWTFKDNSFIPHSMVDKPDADTDTAPVRLGYGTQPGVQADVLINLGDEVPDSFEQYERVTELVDQSQEIKQQARQRFRYYRDKGYTPHTHNL